MHPFKWNAYVIRSMSPAQWTEIDLAGELLTAPKKYMCRLRNDPIPRGYIMEWAGGDQGWVALTVITPLFGFTRWPFGFAVTETVLPPTGPP